MMHLLSECVHFMCELYELIESEGFYFNKIRLEFVDFEFWTLNFGAKTETTALFKQKYW